MCTATGKPSDTARTKLAASGYAPVTARVSLARGSREDVELVVEPPRPVSPAWMAGPAPDAGTDAIDATAPLPAVR